MQYHVSVKRSIMTKFIISYFDDLSSQTLKVTLWFQMFVYCLPHVSEVLHL